MILNSCKSANEIGDATHESEFISYKKKLDDIN